MKKIAISLAALISLLGASSAMAEVGFQFRIPFAVTKASTVSTPSGSSFLLSFDIDSATTVGILDENVTFSDTKPAAALPSSYNITAMRMMKNVSDTVSVGLDLGNITQYQPAGTIVGTGYMADIVGAAKLMSSKGGKVNSYMNVELLYRLAQTSAPAANTSNLGGVQLAIGAGINF